MILSGKSVDRQIIKDFLITLGLDPIDILEININPKYLTYTKRVRDENGNLLLDASSSDLRLASVTEVIDIND